MAGKPLVALCFGQSQHLPEVLEDTHTAPNEDMFNPQRPKSWMRLLTGLSRLFAQHAWARVSPFSRSLDEASPRLSDRLWKQYLATPLERDRETTRKKILAWQAQFKQVARDDLMKQLGLQAATLLLANLDHPERLRYLMDLGLQLAQSGGIRKGLAVLKTISSSEFRQANAPQQLGLLADAMGPLSQKILESRALYVPYLPTSVAKLVQAAPRASQPLPRRTLQALFRTELGDTPAVLFDAWEEHPLQVHPWAQVHRASLGQQRVRVKLVHPKKLEALRQDFLLVEPLVRTLDALFPSANVSEVAHHLLGALKPPASMRDEAQQRARLSQVLGRHSPLLVPAPMISFSSDAILTTPWPDVPPLSAQQGNVDVARRYLEALLKQAFEQPFFPLNPQLAETGYGKLPGQLQPQFVLNEPGDLGVSTTEERQSLARLLVALYAGDATAVASTVLPPSASDAQRQFLATQLHGLLEKPVARFEHASDWLDFLKQMVRLGQQRQLPIQIPNPALASAVATYLANAKALAPGLSLGAVLGPQLASITATSDPWLLMRASWERLNNNLSGPG